MNNMITAKMVNELRSMTGAGMMDCKKALVETEGNMEAAVDYLREKGIAKAAKKADRIAAEGLAKVQWRIARRRQGRDSGRGVLWQNPPH